MPQASHLTVGEIAKIFDAPEWKIRRIVDSLPDEIQRVGRYRLVPRSLLAAIALKLQRHGQSAEEEAAV